MGSLHEKLRRLREGSFQTPTGPVYFQDEQTLRDAMDLLAVTREQHSTGSPNLENDQARLLVRALQGHGLLSNVDLETLRRLVAKYRPQIDQIRKSPDRDGQDYLDVPDGAAARLIDHGG